MMNMPLNIPKLNTPTRSITNSVSSNIPERQPIADLFTGVILQQGTAQALAFGSQFNIEPAFSGTFVVRYGIRFLGKPHQSIIPGLVVLDYGDMLTGEEAWDFLLKRSNLHPRAEVVGYQNDGSDDMVFLRALDFAITPEVLIFADEQANKPIAHPTALIAEIDNDLPTRLLEYLPRYPTVADWQAEIS